MGRDPNKITDPGVRGDPAFGRGFGLPPNNLASQKGGRISASRKRSKLVRMPKFGEAK